MTTFPFINVAVAAWRALTDNRTPRQRWPKLNAMSNGDIDYYVMRHTPAQLDEAESRITLDLHQFEEALKVYRQGTAQLTVADDYAERERAAEARRLAILARSPDPLAGYSTATQDAAFGRIEADIDRLTQEEHEESMRKMYETDR